MSYRVLARKYRSRTFDEVVGQTPIATTLKNAVSSGRIHHGYLFCGTRGVGKTSMARILAKALNCLAVDAPTAEPCGECESCKAIAEGQDIDVIEIDAASNTGVDHIRELRNNAAFRPARSRFKIYIIDEVHMLSTGAFNALLKTLEEPPDHVKFILATTETHKVPATIQSRCLRFDFRSIGVHDIVEQLERILKAEGVSADADAVRRIARLANGSMRDALSLLDQLLSLGKDKLDLAVVDEIMPAPQDDLMPKLMGCVAEADPAGALATVDECVAGGLTPDRFCEMLTEQIRSLMLLRVCGADSALIDIPTARREEWTALSQRFDEPTYVYMIALIEELRRSVRFNGAGRALVDAAVVRLTQSARFSAIETLISGGDAKAAAAALPAGSDAKKKRSDAQPAPTKVAAPAIVKPTAPARSSAPPMERRPATTVPQMNRPAAPTAPPPVTRTAGASASEADCAKALADPVVRRAMEVFEGTLVSVEREAAAPAEVEEE